jgi:hypothetical protein
MSIRVIVAEWQRQVMKLLVSTHSAVRTLSKKMDEHITVAQLGSPNSSSQSSGSGNGPIQLPLYRKSALDSLENDLETDKALFEDVVRDVQNTVIYLR